MQSWLNNSSKLRLRLASILRILLPLTLSLTALPENQVEQLMDDLGQMVEEGFAQEINDTLTALSEIEGGLENALNFDSLEACQAGGRSNCEATAAVMESMGEGS